MSNELFVFIEGFLGLWFQLQQRGDQKRLRVRQVRGKGVRHFFVGHAFLGVSHIHNGPALGSLEDRPVLLQKSQEIPAVLEDCRLGYAQGGLHGGE